MRLKMQLSNLNQMSYQGFKTFVAKLLPRKNSSWKNRLQNQWNKLYSQYLLLSLKFRVYVSHELGNSQILKLVWRRGVEGREGGGGASLIYEKHSHQEFYEKHSHQSCSMRVLKISKQLKSLSEEVTTPLKKTIDVKYYFK